MVVVSHVGDSPVCTLLFCLFLRNGDWLPIDRAMQTLSTSLALPPPIARFFAHDTGDPRALARCFAVDGVVRDEHREHRGRDAIAAWNAEVVAQYGFATEARTVETSGARTTVTAKVSGRFPGSPIELRFVFTVAEELIARLEITP